MKSSTVRNTYAPRGQDSSLASVTSGSSGGSRLTPEMCKAIKRQEITTSMDYWKVGHNGITTHVHDKRPTYSRVTQINLDFPGAFLPTVNGQPNQQLQKPKRRESTGFVLSRSRTTLMPNIIQPKVRVEKVAPTKRTSPELTCLQLADTLFATKNSGFTGFFNFAIPRGNYLDYFGSDSDSSEVDTNKMVPPHGARIQKDHCNRSTNSAIKYRTLQHDDTNTLGDKYEQLFSPTNYGFRSRWNELFSENKKPAKPQKSILKNGVNKQNDDIEPFEATDCCFRETISPPNSFCNTPTIRYQNNHLKLESITPVIERQNSPRSREASQAEVVVRLEGVTYDMAARKRSVRFNSDHEVREYKPCEPVSFC